MIIFRVFFLLSALVCLSGCEKKLSADSLRKQLHEAKIELIVELQMIERPGQFETHESKVSELFEDIAECMIQAKLLPSELSRPIVIQEDSFFSDALRSQCVRIIALPGGENWLIKCQARAVRLLDKESH